VAHYRIGSRLSQDKGDTTEFGAKSVSLAPEAFFEFQKHTVISHPAEAFMGHLGAPEIHTAQDWYGSR